jgi:ATP synthase protein I
MKEKPPTPSVYTALGALAGIGFTIAVPMALGTYLGYLLDSHFNTKPLFILLGLLLGLISGISGAYRLYKSVFQ